jgi:hypothetical protein
MLESLPREAHAVRIGISAVLLLANASVLSSQIQPTVSWLEPPDVLIQKAIDDGFAQQKLPKDAKYHKYLNWIKPAVDSRIEVIPPLFCAMEAGQHAHDKLEAKPSLEHVKNSCLHRVTVVLVHYSQALRANWPCVFQKGEVTLQATLKVPDDNPSVAKYYGGFIAGDEVGYRYIDLYTFEFPDALASGASLTYADEAGQHHTLNYDFAVFAKDVGR